MIRYQMLDGYSICVGSQLRAQDIVRGLTTRTLAPNACGGRFDLNFDLTTPEFPCGRVTRLHAVVRSRKRTIRMRTYPQMTRTLEPARSVLAR